MQKNEAPEAKSNCLHSSNHLSLFISPFPPVLSSISLSSFLCRFSLIHHLVSQSLTPPAYILPLFFPSVIPSAFLASVCLFLNSLSLLNTVVSRLLSPSVFFVASCCVSRPCFNVTQLAPCHTDYCWRVQERCMYEIYTRTHLASPARPVSVIMLIKLGVLPGAGLETFKCGVRLEHSFKERKPICKISKNVLRRI